MEKRYKNIFIIILFLFLNGYYFSETVSKSVTKKKVDLTTTAVIHREKTDECMGILEIPKINLKQEFYDYLSKKNNVDKNIEVIETSQMPDILNSNLILASHSGSSKIAYFKNLYKVKEGDLAYITYNGKKYTYQMLYVYDEEKDGVLSIRRRKDQTNLTLITCDKKNNHVQNVYVFKLIHD